MPEVEYKVTAKSESQTKTTVSTENFDIIIDEPENLGGTNEGPNPVEYLLASLAGCLNIVANMVAKEMDLELRDLEMEIKGVLDPDKLAGRSEEKRAGYKEIEVSVDADVNTEDEDILQKWIETVKERCPVSDNISHETPVSVSIK